MIIHDIKHILELKTERTHALQEIGNNITEIKKVLEGSLAHKEFVQALIERAIQAIESYNAEVNQVLLRIDALTPEELLDVMQELHA